MLVRAVPGRQDRVPLGTLGAPAALGGGELLSQSARGWGDFSKMLTAA